MRNNMTIDQELYKPSNAVIIILGSYNNEQGKLSKIAKSRLNKGSEEYKKHKNYKIILTGGYGEHFNPTSKPHAFYAKKFLLSLGISDESILDFVESKFTLEDALLAKPIIEKQFVKNLIIVSSDYHIKRVKYIFGQVFNNYNLSYSAAITNVSRSEMCRLEEQENMKLSMFLKNNKQLMRHAKATHEHH